MNKADLPFLSATALGELIRQRDISPVEATEAYLERIDAIDGTLHSYITVCRQDALQAARAAEQDLAHGAYRGPLHGVPYAVKDQFWTQGLLTTGGSTILGDFVPDEDATVVARLRTAGAVLLGKLNMSKSLLQNSVHHPYGTPRNPWDLRRNLAPVAAPGPRPPFSAPPRSAKTPGFIRNPANNCGLVGIRPPGGLVSRYGMLGPAGRWTSLARSRARSRTVP